MSIFLLLYILVRVLEVPVSTHTFRTVVEPRCGLCMRNDLVLPFSDRFVWRQELEAHQQHVVPDEDQQHDLHSHQPGEGEPGPGKLVPDVGHGVPQPAGDHVAHDVDLAVPLILLAGAAVLPEEVDDEVCVLQHLPEHGAGEGQDEAPAEVEPDPGGEDVAEDSVRGVGEAVRIERVR